MGPVHGALMGGRTTAPEERIAAGWPGQVSAYSREARADAALHGPAKRLRCRVDSRQAAAKGLGIFCSHDLHLSCGKGVPAIARATAEGDLSSPAVNRDLAGSAAWQPPRREGGVVRRCPGHGGRHRGVAVARETCPREGDPNGIDSVDVLRRQHGKRGAPRSRMTC